MKFILAVALCAVASAWHAPSSSSSSSTSDKHRFRRNYKKYDSSSSSSTSYKTSDSSSKSISDMKPKGRCAQEGMRPVKGMIDVVGNEVPTQCECDFTKGLWEENGKCNCDFGKKFIDGQCRIPKY